MWLEKNYHHLIYGGDVEYQKTDRLLNSLKFKYIYVKEQKQIINEFIPHIVIINSEELECSRLDQLCVEDTLPCCIFHMNLNPKQCIF